MGGIIKIGKSMKFRHLSGPKPLHKTVRKQKSKPKSGGGPGTELKKMLARFGIRPTKSCKCNARAAMMDHKGPDWCERNLEKIVGWLKEESDRRKLPFVKSLGRMLIRRAIKKSRKSISVESDRIGGV